MGTPGSATAAAIGMGGTRAYARTASSRPSGNAGRGSAKRHTTSAHQRRADAKAAAKVTGRHNRNGGSHGKPKRHRVLAWIAGIIGAMIVAGIGLFAYLWITTDIPNPEDIAISQKTTVYYKDGTTPIGSFAEQNRTIIDCSTLPSYVGNAVVASENRTFWTDSGIDLKGIGRALLNNVTKGTRQGGSTITQQYAERYYLGQTDTYLGKVHEAILALKIAQTQDKSQVLCNYLNIIYLGRDSYGIEAASQNYFGKSAKDLTLDEATTLAGIIPAPNTWDPAVDPDQATARMERTLNIMKEDGYVSDTDVSSAKLPDTIDYTPSDVYGGWKGYLLTTVRNELVASKAFDESEIDTGGYSIITTIDQTKQEAMQSVGDVRLDDMPANLQVGGISADPRDGSVLAMYGGPDYLTHQLNNATQSTFEPGSTMKPFGLLGAAQEGVNFNTMFNGNSGQTFAGANGVVNNALNMNWGNINLYQATANSVNSVFMNVNEHLTPQKLAQIAHTAGITGDIDENSIYNILGINSITAWDLTQGHATIAANGVKNTLHVVASVKNTKGQDLYTFKAENEKVFDANDTALVQQAMQGTTTTGTAAGMAAELGRPIAGKSGTANDEFAASFVGYVPQMITTWAIWNPDDNGSPQVVPAFSGYGVSSTGYPAHLFTEYMKTALQGEDVIEFPTATDDGKLGGPDGTWGLGYGSTGSGTGNGGTGTWGRNEGESQSQTTEGNTGAGTGTGSGSGSGDGGTGTGGTGNGETGGTGGSGSGTGGTDNSGSGTGGNGGNGTGNSNGGNGGSTGDGNGGTGTGGNGGNGNSGSGTGGTGGSGSGTGTNGATN